MNYNYCPCICPFRRKKRVKDSAYIRKMLFYIVYAHVKNKSALKFTVKKKPYEYGFFSNELFAEPFNNYYFYYFSAPCSVLRTKMFSQNQTLPLEVLQTM